MPRRRVLHGCQNDGGLNGDKTGKSFRVVPHVMTIRPKVHFLLTPSTRKMVLFDANLIGLARNSDTMNGVNRERNIYIEVGELI